MAVSVDTVYQKVLALANKEQRGYITPQEFNLFADQAQKEIFEQHFYDINQFSKVPGNSYAYSDMITNLEEKIHFFEKYDKLVTVTSSGQINLSTELPDLYRIGTVRISYQTEPMFRVAEEIQLNELTKYGQSPLGKNTKTRPVYTRYATDNTPDRMRVYPNPSSDPTIDRVLISYIKKLTSPQWGYVVVNGYAQYDSNSSINFELHSSEENELVLKILQSSGLVMKDVGLYQVAAQEEMKDIQQEKQ